MHEDELDANGRWRNSTHTYTHTHIHTNITQTSHKHHTHITHVPRIMHVVEEQTEKNKCVEAGVRADGKYKNQQQAVKACLDCITAYAVTHYLCLRSRK